MNPKRARILDLFTLVAMKAEDGEGWTDEFDEAMRAVDEFAASTCCHTHDVEVVAAAIVDAEERKNE